MEKNKKKNNKISDREKQEIKSLNKKIISEFVNIAIATSKIKKIEVEQENGILNLRTNLNIFLYGSIGSTKSTLLNEIHKKVKCPEPFTDLTYPALIGSIDKLTRQLMIGACWEVRNSLLLLDEYDFGKRKKDDIKSLLQLIEGGKYNKKLASFSAPSEEQDEDLYYNFKNGTFNIFTRFSLVIATMKYPYTSQNKELQALVSRCICIPFYPSKAELRKIAQGYKLFNYVDKTIPETYIRVKKKDYKFINDYVDDRIDKQNYLRILGDCIRVFVIEKKHRTDLYDYIIKYGSKSFQSKIKK